MSDDLFTDEPPKEPGWYWVRRLELSGWREIMCYWHGSHSGTGVLFDSAGRHYTICGSASYDFGPRIPTPEQCAAMAKE